MGGDRPHHPQRAVPVVRFVAGSPVLVPVAAFGPGELDAFGRIALRNGLTLDGHRVDVPAR